MIKVTLKDGSTLTLQDIDADDEKVLLCIRKKSSLASIWNQKRTNEYHEYCIEVFKNIFEFEAP